MNIMALAQIAALGIALILLALSVGFLFYSLRQLGEEVARSRRMRFFEGDLLAAIGTKPPTWDQLKVIFTSRTVPHGEAKVVITNLLREALTGRRTEVRDQVSLLEGYLKCALDEEPFVDIPDSLRPHLARIQSRLGDDSPFLQPLIKEIRELVEINSRDRRRQRIIAVVSLTVGIIGLLVTIVGLIAPYVEGSKREAVTQSAQKLPNPGSQPTPKQGAAEP